MTDPIIDIHKKLTAPALNNNWEVSREGHLFKRERASILNYYTNQTPEGSNGFTLIGILPTLEKTKKKNTTHIFIWPRHNKRVYRARLVNNEKKAKTKKVKINSPRL